MRRLARARQVAQDDRGAVVVLVGVLLAAGVLTGMLAIVVDLGRLYAERRVVQNSADAAALAVAQHCAKAPADAACANQAAAQSVAQDLANGNAPDGLTDVTEVCGASPLAGCVATTQTWSNCLAPPAGARFARVRTRTMQGPGDYLLPAIFAGLTSPEGKPDLSAGACAQAAWGTASSALVVLPFVLPACPDVPYGEPVVIEDFDPADPNTSCSTLDGTFLSSVTKGFAFADLPSENMQCTVPVSISVGDVLPVETSLTQLCGPDISATLDPYIASGDSLVFPVVGGHARTGQGQYAFTIITFRSYVLYGYKLKNKQGGDAPPRGWSATACGNSAQRSCLYGTFVQEVVPGGIGTGPNLGVQAVALIP
jgi:Flp pilus assembly protein TadG